AARPDDPPRGRRARALLPREGRPLRGSPPAQRVLRPGPPRRARTGRHLPAADRRPPHPARSPGGVSDRARRARGSGDPAQHRLHRPPLRRDRDAAASRRAARLHDRRPAAPPRRTRLLAARRAASLADLGRVHHRPAAGTPAVLRGARVPVVHPGRLPGGRPARLRRREPRAAARGARGARRRDLRHPDREPPRPQPQPRHRGRHRPVRGSAAARNSVKPARHVPALVLALLAACTTIPLPRESTFHPSDADLAVPRITHGSFALELHGTRLLVAPWFHSSLLTRRREPLGLPPATLPKLNAVLLAGGGVPGCDPPALPHGAPGPPRGVVPPALRERILALGFHDVTGLAWWERTDVDGVTITAVPTSAGPRENGYVLVSQAARLY